MDWPMVWMALSCCVWGFITCCCAAVVTCTVYCNTGTVPDTMELEIVGGVAGSPNIGSCGTDCEEWNGTVWLLPLQFEDASQCSWWLDYGDVTPWPCDPCCGYTRVQVLTIVNQFRVHIVGSGITVVGTFTGLKSSGGDPPEDCCSFVEELCDNMVDIEPDLSGFTGPCTWVDAEFLLTSGEDGDCA